MTILDPAESELLRSIYIETFVDASSQYYKSIKEHKEKFGDGRCYNGYLWDCLLDPEVIKKHRADLLLMEKSDIYIMCEPKSCDSIVGHNCQDYSGSVILYVEAWSDSLAAELPEDLYIFDETFKWSVIFTHETDQKNRPYCLYTNCKV